MYHVVLGGAGFIGSNLSNLLMNSGEKILVVDNLSLGKVDFISANDDLCSVIIGDVNEKLTWSKIKECIKESEIFIWHLVANSDIKSGAESHFPDLHNTLNTTVKIIENLSEFVVKGVCFASSSAVYGDVNEFPSEKDLKDPISYYGVSKLASENFLKIKCSSMGIPLWIFRFANVVGAPATHGVIFDFCLKLTEDVRNLQVLGNGSQTKAYIHVGDLNNVMLDIVGSCPIGGIWNLGPMDTGISVAEIAELVCNHLAPSAQIAFGEANFGWPGDIPHIVLDSGKLRDEISVSLPGSRISVEKALHDICKQMHLEFVCDKQL